MGEAPKKPHYSAAIFDSSNVELTPVAVADAGNDADAIKFATQQAHEWLAVNRTDRAPILHIVKDGAILERIPLEPLP